MIRFFHSVLLLLLSTVSLIGEELVLSPSMDSSIYFETDSSNSAGEHLFSGATALRNQLAPRRAMLAFDIASSVPADAVIRSASLSLTVNRVPNSAVTNMFGLHRITQDWLEGDTNAGGPEGQGASAEGNDVSWTSAGVTNWNTPGGDFVAEPSGLTEVAGVGTYAWSSPGMIVDLQSWLDNGSNFGWMLVGEEDMRPKTAKRFASRTNGNEASRPQLTIQFDIVSTLFGDFNGDGELLADDIGYICAAINDGQNASEFDLDGSQTVDLGDVTAWVETIKGTSLGDNDLNGSVEFADFLALSASFGSLEVPDPRPREFSGWSSGDYNCNDQVGFEDFLQLSANFGTSGPAENLASVPEPAAGNWFALVIGISLAARGSRGRPRLP